MDGRPVDHNDSRLDSRRKSQYCSFVVKVPLYTEIKAREAKQRRVIMRQRGSRSAMARQRQVSLVGDGAKWRITNLPQVVAAMAKWA
jgi:hypothetical protein